MKEMIVLGSAKKKRTAMRIKRIHAKNAIKKKMGKPIFFTLTYCNKKLSGISNQYCYKSNMHNLCFVNAQFYNVKYQASIITNCNFRESTITGVDFFNCNMKKSSFKNATLKHVVFYNCNLKGVNFSETTFEDVTFICTNLQISKNLIIDNPEIKILHTYKQITLDEPLEISLLNLAQNDSIYNSKVLHVNKNKLNHWSLRLIHQKYGDTGIKKLNDILRRKKQWNNMNTIFSYISLVKNWKK